jgi:predicted DNA-binding transcriptional regulator AlpA
MSNYNYKFEDMPNLLGNLIDKVNNLESIITKQNSCIQPTDELLDTDGAAAFLGCSKQHIYLLSMQGKIPKIKRPGSKKIMFLKADLINWLKQSKHEPVSNLKSGYAL